MKQIRCQHKGVSSRAKCPTKAHVYLNDREIYVCNHHHRISYRDEDSTELTDFSTVETTIKAVDDIRRNFLQYFKKLKKTRAVHKLFEEDKVAEFRIRTLKKKLKEAQKEGEYYKFGSLLEEAQEIEDNIKSKPLYSEFSDSTKRNNSLSGANQRHTKSQNTEGIHEEDSQSSSEEDSPKSKKSASKPTRRPKKRARRSLDESSEQTPPREGTRKNNKTKERKNKRTRPNTRSKKEPKEESKEDTNYRPKKRELKRIALQREEDSEDYQEEQISTKSKQHKRQDTMCSKKQEDAKMIQKLKKIAKDLEQCEQQKQDLAKELANNKWKMTNLQKKYEKDMLKAKEEKDKMAQEIKDILYNPEKRMQSLISKLNLSEYSGLSLLYKITTGKDKQFGPETVLPLNLKNPKDMEFLTSLNKRMPDIARLDLYNIPLNCQEVKTFLATHFPNKVRNLHFNCWPSLSSCLAFYLEELVEVSKRVTGHLYIHKFEISQDQLVALFSANRHKQCFGLRECKLSLSSVPDFGGTLAGSTMQALDLYDWGGSSYGDWGNNESHFENLIAGLSKEEDFRKNLERIGMCWCGIEKNVVEKILADHGFGHVEIEWDFVLF